MAWVPLAAAGISVLGSYLISKNNENGGDPRNDIYQQSTLSKYQRKLDKQRYNAIKGPGAGGAFGDVADYYRGNLSENPRDFDTFAAPDIRRYNEETVPGISEQFAGMGSGGLSSSGFRNAQIQGATDLSERLGALRANLRQNSAAGLQNLANGAFQPNVENVRNTPQATFGEGVAEGFGKAAVPAALDWYKNQNANTSATANAGTQTSPYQSNNIPASPTVANNPYGVVST